jgi:hypothetical protein
MVTVHLEMEPFPGPIDLSKAAVIIIDMQVRIVWSGINIKEATRRFMRTFYEEASGLLTYCTLSLRSAISWSREVLVRCSVTISPSWPEQLNPARKCWLPLDPLECW